MVPWTGTDVACHPHYRADMNDCTSAWHRCVFLYPELTSCLIVQERHVRATWQLIASTATALFTGKEE